MDSSSSLSFDAISDGIDFSTAPFAEPTEITGPLAATLWVSTTAVDCDLFLTVLLLDPAGTPVSFVGAVDPHAPVSQGWLRLSHRSVDAAASRPFRPVHTHLDADPVTPGEVRVEIWPTSIVVPAGWRISLRVGGQDFADRRLPVVMMSNFKNQMTGVGPFLHDDPVDRSASTFGGTTTLYLGGDTPSRLLVPRSARVVT